MQRRGSASQGCRVILGISCDFHDAAAALVVDGEIAAAAEEERFTRIKHDRSLPVRSIASCLAIAGLSPDDVDVVVFYERPMAVLQRYLASRQRIGPAGVGSFARDAPRLIGSNLLVGYRIDRALRQLGATRSPRFRYVDHHQSHAAAAFYPSPFHRAAILTVDGIGEFATASIRRGHGRRIEPIEELRYPHSLGLVYSLITAYCGFRPNDDEYKVMGLAPYGSPTFAEALAELASVHEDGSVAVDARRTAWYAARALRRRDLHRLLGGPPRDADAPLTQRDADLAASVQQLTETAMVRMADRAQELTGESHLCLAGGVALNCVATGKLRSSDRFDGVWVQPAAGDAGSALGAALSYWHEAEGNERPAPTDDRMAGAFLGPRALPAEIDAWAGSLSEPVRRLDPGDLEAEVADRLASGAVVGWFSGAMEFGPRALGHRSILADPRSPTVRRELNLRVKGREGFRPFAPAVLAERAPEWFDLDGDSRFMSFTAQVASRHLLDTGAEPSDLSARADLPRSTIPACTHIDGSARVQTVDADANPALHRLLLAFERRTGCPVLVNTSFNRAGEPIVATPDDALRTARAAGLDLLVVEDRVIDLADDRGLAPADAPGTGERR
jgi:carbamoyltransferase